MTTIRYTGPGGVALNGVGELKHGQEYDLPAERAKKLAKRHDFELVDSGSTKKADTPADDKPKEAAE